MNPAEFLADLISIDYSSADSVYSSQKRIYGLVESFSRYSSTILYAIPIEKRQVLAGKESRKSKLLKKGGWWRQFCLLLKRAWMQVNIGLIQVENIDKSYKRVKKENLCYAVSDTIKMT